MLMVRVGLLYLRRWRDKYLKGCLADYFDRVKVDIKSDLSNWHKGS